jgi:uncharacterized protein YbbC (DUF1343 family)
VDGALRHAVDLLGGRDDLRLARLFAPEHGVRGEAQDMESVEERADSGTGLPVVSLYRRDEASLRPAPRHLRDLDVVLVDLQDVGSRYYTFVYTMAYVMEACRDERVPVAVLDRPNPIGGLALEGPVLEPGLESFVGRYPIPARHGMTCAELARLFNDEFGIGCDLRVVPMEGWRRAMQFEDAGLPWVLPSPNLPTPDTARVYPGACLVEGTNLSEGRGTTRPFELIGAPWLDGRALAAALEREGLEGVRFRPACFRPTFQKHAGRSCGGVQVHVTDRAAFRPFAAYLALLRAARAQDPSSFAWRSERYEFVSDRLAIDLLLGRRDLRHAIEAGASVAEMEALWRDDLGRFASVRGRFLLYES